MPSRRKVGVPGKRGLPHDFVPVNRSAPGQWMLPGGYPAPGFGMMAAYDNDGDDDMEDEHESSSSRARMLCCIVISGAGARGLN